MKPSLLLALFFVTILSACTGGNPTPTAPSQQPNQTQATPSVQQSNPLKHVYTRAGNFTATFSVTNAAGDTASASIAVLVR